MKMLSSGATNSLHCVHSYHLFSHPLCEDQSLLKRVVNVAFHVLTLGIPLAIYNIISCCYAKPASKPQGRNLQTRAISSTRQIKKAQPSSLRQKAEDIMKKEIENKICKGYQKILDILAKDDNPLKEIAFQNELQSIAVKIHLIWSKHSLDLKVKSEGSIDKEKIYEVLDPLIKLFPLLQEVKDKLIAIK